MCVRKKSWKIIYFSCVELLLLLVVGVFYVEPLKYHQEFIVCVRLQLVCMGPKSYVPSEKQQHSLSIYATYFRTSFASDGKICGLIANTSEIYLFLRRK